MTASDPLALHHLARLLAGASDADLDLIHGEWPDAPLDDARALRDWLKDNPQIAAAVAKIDPEGPSPDAPPLAPYVLSADVLLTSDWPEPRWAIPDLLPAGLTNAAGRPKVGKSWLLLQIALSVATGGIALGRRVEKGAVLYLALEDPPRRLAERMKKQGWPVGKTDADFLTLGGFAEQVGDLRKGGATTLARQIEARVYRLVVVDTLS